MKMVKLSLGKVLESLCLSSSGSSSSGNGNIINSCFCMNSIESEEDEFEKSSLLTGENKQLLRLKDVVDGTQTLAFQLKPKMVTLRVSMHCNGCAKRVEKHISNMEGVTSYKVDLETKMVMVIGDILPFEVLESVSKVKNAELWNSPN